MCIHLICCLLAYTLSSVPEFMPLVLPPSIYMYLFCCLSGYTPTAKSRAFLGLKQIQSIDGFHKYTPDRTLLEIVNLFLYNSS